MIINVVMTHATTGERRTLKMEGESWSAIRKAARAELKTPWPEWNATSEKSTDVAPVKVRKPKKDLPSIDEMAAQRICPECGGEVTRKSAKGPFPTFCSDPVKNCKKVRGNRRLVRGSAIIEFAQAWRVNRGSGEVAQQSFQQFCNILDQFNAEDREDDRPRADLCAAKVLVERTLYIDRQKGGKFRRKEKPEAAPVDELAALRAKVADEATTDNERAVLSAALEILTAKAA